MMLLGVSALLTFSSAIAAPFVFDDRPGIDANASIRQPADLWRVFEPPRDTPVAGRPIVNLTLALNYAVNNAIGIDQDGAVKSPARTVGYHLVNILIHAFNAILLFVVLRRTLARWRPDGLNGEGIAAIASLFWLLHPIQADAVDYTIQRTELVVSFFYLLTLYCCTRAYAAMAEGGRGTAWTVAAITACAAGMASKEVMITAPVMMVLYDHVFFARSWKEQFADRPRIRLYSGLFLTTLVVLAYLASGARSHSVGLNLGMPWYRYLYSQCWAIPHYLRLLLWPSGLTFDYGEAAIGGIGAAVGSLILLVCLLLSAAAWRRSEWRWIGFAGAWFFILIAPSSSVIPIKTEIAAERRVYLASASLIVVAVVGLAMLARRIHLRRLGLNACIAVIALALAACTFRRGLTFSDDELLFRDAVQKTPDNPRAYVGLGLALGKRGPAALPEAIETFQKAIAIDSTSSGAWQSLGIAYVVENAWPQAAVAFHHVLLLQPENLDAAAGMARAQLHMGNADSAAAYAHKIGDADPELLWMLGYQFLQLHRPSDALPYLEHSAGALPAGPAMALMSVAYAEMGNDSAAVRSAQSAVQNAPTSPGAFVFAARGMRLLHRNAAAKAYLERALALDPNSPLARAELDSLLPQGQGVHQK